VAVRGDLPNNRHNAFPGSNQIGGSVPTEIGNLFSLQWLSLGTEIVFASVFESCKLSAPDLTSSILFCQQKMILKADCLPKLEE
jgi:hypothetical protein